MTAVQVSVYSTTGGFLKVLTDARDLSFSVDESVSFSIAKDSPEAAYFTAPVGIGVEIEALAGGSFGLLNYSARGEVTGRYIYTASDTARKPVGGDWNITAVNIGVEAFSVMPALGSLAGDKLQYLSTDNPATVVANRILENRNRGLDYGITVIDAGGWAATTIGASIPFDDGAYLADYYQSLRDGKNADVAWVGTTLNVMPTGTLAAIDQTSAVIFQDDDFTEDGLSIDYDWSYRADTVLAIGSGNIQASYPATPTGRVVTVTFSGITDTATLATAAQNEWKIRQRPARQISGTLALGLNPRLLPFRDFHVGTLVRIPDGAGGTEIVGIAGITGSGLGSTGSPVELGASIVFDTKIIPKEVRQQRQLKAITGGTVLISGNGRALPSAVRDAGWISYVPALNQTTGINVAGIVAKYRRTGQRVRVEIVIPVSGALANATYNNVSLPSGLPASPATIATGTNDASFMGLGSAFFIDTSANTRYAGFTLLSSTTSAAFGIFAGSPVQQQWVAPTVPMTWANGDVMKLTFEYLTDAP